MFGFTITNWPWRLALSRLLVGVFFSLALSGLCLAKDHFAVIENRPNFARIIIGDQPGEILKNAAQALRDVIATRTGILLNIDHQISNTTSGVVIYLGERGSNQALLRELNRAGIKPVDLKDPGPEGFVLFSRREAARTIIGIQGSDELGAFHGAGWLLRRMDFDTDVTTVPLGLNMRSAPSTAMRRIRFGDHCGYVNVELPGWHEIWTDYIFWGLSAVTFRCDPAHQGDPRASFLARYLWDKWTERVPLAKSLGLKVVHLTQSNLTFKDGEFGPGQVADFKELNAACPDFNGVNPKSERGMKLLMDSRRWFFDHLPHIDQVDYFLTSGWDGGGCADPAVAPWAVTYAGLIDQYYPMIAVRNSDAKIILGLYGCPPPEAEALAEKFKQGWHPSWLDALELADSDISRIGMAALFPSEIKRMVIPLWGTAYGVDQHCGDMGANPAPRMVAESCRLFFENGLRDGIGVYSEGTYDFVNTIGYLQRYWSPELSMDTIMDDLCHYYFGAKAASTVKDLIDRLEKDMPGTRAGQRPDIQTRIVQANKTPDPEISRLAAEAEQLMPAWARSSRQWGMIASRVKWNVAQWRFNELIKRFDEHWKKYLAYLRSDAVAGHAGADIQATLGYFKELIQNGREQVNVYHFMDRHAYGIQGGFELQSWPDTRMGGVCEAIRTIGQLDAGSRTERPGRPCAAYVNQSGEIVVADGWGNMIATAIKPLDVKLVVADIMQVGSDQVFYLADQHGLSFWTQLKGNRKLAKGPFLTGPLAVGDFLGQGHMDLLALAGDSPARAELVRVNSKGEIQKLDLIPSGPDPLDPVKDVFSTPSLLRKNVCIDWEPMVAVGDMNGDGKKEVICGDREREGELVVVDELGRRMAKGPLTAGGVVAAGDLNGDGRDEAIFLNAAGELCCYSLAHGKIAFKEKIKPRWGRVVLSKFKGAKYPAVVYVDSAGYICSIELDKPSRRLSDLSSSVAMAPNMVAADFDDDGQEEVLFLRRRLYFKYPLASLWHINGEGDLRGLEMPNDAPFGIQASGYIRFSEN